MLEELAPDPEAAQRCVRIAIGKRIGHALICHLAKTLSWQQNNNARPNMNMSAGAIPGVESADKKICNRED